MFIRILSSNYYFSFLALYMKSKNTTNGTNFFKKTMGLSTIPISIAPTMDTRNHSLEDFKNCFFFFLEEFGPIASGYNNFSPRKKQMNSFQDSCTPSDEALVLFFLNVNWDCWVNEIDNSDGMKKRKQVCNKKYSGWTSDDVKKFNDFCHMVASARENVYRKNLEEQFKKSNRYHSTLTYHENQESFEVPNNTVVPYTDLLDEFDDNSSSLVTPNMSQDCDNSFPNDVIETEAQTEHFSQEHLEASFGNRAAV